jgi:endoglucanase
MRRMVLFALGLPLGGCLTPPSDPAAAPPPKAVATASAASPVAAAAPSAPAPVNALVPGPENPKRGEEASFYRYLVIDQFGYRPEMTKVAVLVDPQAGPNASDDYEPGETLEIRKWGDGSVVFTGKPSVWNQGQTQSSAGDRGFWFDFSAVREAGSYFVFDPRRRVRSHRFEIDRDVYRPVLRAAQRMFFYNRANFAKRKPYACVGDRCWEIGADYVGPGQDREARSVRKRDDAKTARDLSGGWWDAGDTDKYVTFARAPVHQLLTAFQEHPGPFTDDTGIPESGNGRPDLVDELLVEIDWLKKMQPADLQGGVLIKMGNTQYGEPKPDQDQQPRFYYPDPCSSSTIAAAGMFAHAALVLGKLPKLDGYAADLRKRAVAAWDRYQTMAQSDQCDDGTIKAGDADVPLAEQDAESVVAGVYLFALTGDRKYEQAITKHLGKTRPFTEDRWSVYDVAQGESLIFYASLPNADPDLKAKIVKQKQDQAARVEIYRMRPELDLYRAYMREDSYHWGSNMPRANFGNTNYQVIQYGLAPEADRATYLERAAGMLHSFHGVNPMQLVYLSNMAAYGAEESATEIYHTWFRDGDPDFDSSRTSRLGPAPGYVTGGPNHSYCKDAKDHPCQTSPLTTWPSQKAYRDFNTGWDPKQEYDQSWELTEPAIYYQASYVMLLSKFVD